MAIEFNEMLAKSKLFLQKKVIHQVDFDHQYLLQKINGRRSKIGDFNSNLLDKQAVLRIELKDSLQLNSDLKHQIQTMGNDEEIEKKIEEKVEFINTFITNVNMTLDFLNQNKVEVRPLYDFVEATEEQ